MNTEVQRQRVFGFGKIVECVFSARSSSHSGFFCMKCDMWSFMVSKCLNCKYFHLFTENWQLNTSKYLNSSLKMTELISTKQDLSVVLLTSKETLAFLPSIFFFVVKFHKSHSGQSQMNSPSGGYSLIINSLTKSKGKGDNKIMVKTIGCWNKYINFLCQAHAHTRAHPLSLVFRLFVSICVLAEVVRFVYSVNEKQASHRHAEKRVKYAINTSWAEL